MFEREVGGKPYCKQIILQWLRETQGLNAKLLETATGLPWQILHPLLAELMEEGEIKLDRVIFKRR